MDTDNSNGNSASLTKIKKMEAPDPALDMETNSATDEIVQNNQKYGPIAKSMSNFTVPALPTASGAAFIPPPSSYNLPTLNTWQQFAETSPSQFSEQDILNARLRHVYESLSSVAEMGDVEERELKKRLVERLLEASSLECSKYFFDMVNERSFLVTHVEELINALYQYTISKASTTISGNTQALKNFLKEYSSDAHSPISLPSFPMSPLPELAPSPLTPHNGLLTLSHQEASDLIRSVNEEVPRKGRGIPKGTKRGKYTAKKKTSDKAQAAMDAFEEENRANELVDSLNLSGLAASPAPFSPFHGGDSDSEYSLPASPAMGYTYGPPRTPQPTFNKLSSRDRRLPPPSMIRVLEEATGLRTPPPLDPENPLAFGNLWLPYRIDSGAYVDEKTGNEDERVAVLCKLSEKIQEITDTAQEEQEERQYDMSDFTRKKGDDFYPMP